MTNWEKRFEEAPRRTAFGVGVSAILIVAGLSAVGSVAYVVLTPIRTATGIIDRVANPDNVIANYEWFKRQVQDVRAIDDRIGVSQQALDGFLASAGSRDGWKFDDRQEYSRLNSVLLGLKSQRTSMVAEYNARTQMANRALFKTSDLPDTLN